MLPGLVLLAGYLAACGTCASFTDQLLAAAGAGSFVVLVGIQALYVLAALGGVLTFALAHLARRPVRSPRPAGAPAADAARAAKS